MPTSATLTNPAALAATREQQIPFSQSEVAEIGQIAMKSIPHAFHGWLCMIFLISQTSDFTWG